MSASQERDAPPREVREECTIDLGSALELRFVRAGLFVAMAGCEMFLPRAFLTEAHRVLTREREVYAANRYADPEDVHGDA